MELIEDLIELFGFGLTGVSLLFSKGDSLRESGIKILGTDFDSSCERKSSSSAPAFTSSVLTCVCVCGYVHPP